VAHPLFPTLLASLETLRICLTQPGFEKLLVLFIGWVRTAGTHAVTETLVVTGVAGRRHHEAYHRFFSRGTWSPDSFGYWLFNRIEKLLMPGSPIRVAVDDTLAPKKGPHVFGLGSHIDPVRSTVARKIFCFGHCWVVLAVVLPVPLCRCTFALPILFRLYTNKKTCEKKGLPYRKKTELAVELIQAFAGWTGARRIELAVDSGYANETVVKDLPASVVLFGAMRPDAVLTETPAAPSAHRNGRPRVRGAVLPKPEALAKNDAQPWLTCNAHLYGRATTVHYKTLLAQWYQACGTRLLRIVVVRVDTGRIGLRVFFCTDATISIRDLLEGYAGRWTIEVCFRNLKQLFGFADSSARTKAAVERTAPFVGSMYSLLIVWFFQHAHSSEAAQPPVRPWYPHKRGVSFADILRAAQRVLAPVEVLDLVRPRKDLRETRPSRHRSPQPASKTAARARRRLAA
jgi:DDE superfamily endonuclease